MSKHNQEDIYDIILSHFNNASQEVVEEMRQEIKALMLELVGKDEYETGMQGDDKIATRHADLYRAELRQKINEL